MKYIYSISLFVGGVLAIYYAIQLCCSREKMYAENRLLAIFCVASAIWSIGFSGLIVQQRTEPAYFCRTIGMAGVFLYLISVQALVGRISGVSGRWQRILNGIALSGILVYFMVIRESQIVYKLSSFGMTCYLRPGISKISYVVYTGAIAVDMLIVTAYMLRKSNSKRIRAFGGKVLLVECLLAAGVVLDEIYPRVGLFAVIGSAYTQCLGMIIMYYAVNVINHSRINIMNMSEFIYYSLAMPVLVYDTNQRIHIMNDAAVTFLGVARERMETENIRISQLFSIDDQQVFCFDEKHRDVDAVCQSNQVYCSLAVSKIDDIYGDTIGYIIIVTDLTERIKAIEQLKEAKYEAETANHAKSTFLAKMSHEIRTPMNAIVGFSELALKSELQPQVRDYIEDIKSSSNNLLAIINDILDISKIESGRMELVCGDYYPARLFQDVYLIINTQIKKKGLEFQIEIDPDIPRKLYGDKIRIRSILINLLNNAVKYTQQGQVSFRASVIKKEEDQVTLQFKVEDTGTGIREEEQDKLFEIFSQLDQRRHYGIEGTGLGLSIVKGYVNLMGGNITVDSVYKKGSVFTATIDQRVLDAAPLDRSYIKEDEEADEFSLGNLKIHGVRVLVVDDNQVNLKVAGSSMSYYGLEVDTASSGEEAIRLCQENQYQMIFMDQMMPQMDGIEAMQRIRRLNAYYTAAGNCKMIVLTANAVSGVRNQLMEQGFDEYLGKPMNYQQLERIFVRFLPKECLQYVEQAEKSGETALTQENEVDLSGGQTKESSRADEIGKLQELLPQVEVKQGIRNGGGHLEDYLSILQVVYSSGNKQLEELEQLQKQKDYENYTIQIHAVKGAALNIGANKTADLAKQQEQAGKKGDYAYIDANVEIFQQAYHQLLEEIHTVLEFYQMPIPDQEETSGSVLTKTDAERLFLEINACIEAFDYAKAADLVREAGKCKLPKQYQKEMPQIEQWMQEMEVERIQEMIERIRQDEMEDERKGAENV